MNIGPEQCSGVVLSSRSEMDKATLKTLWVHYRIAQMRQRVCVVGRGEASMAQEGRESPCGEGSNQSSHEKS